MKLRPIILSLGIMSFMFISSALSAQSFKDKMKSKIPKKDNSAMYECGYVHKATLAEKANPMKALQKGIGGVFTVTSNSDLNAASISVVYQAHNHPSPIIRYPTKTDGWETCGDAVFAGFTNRNGMGMSTTDGKFTVDGKELEPAGMGTYYYGFKPAERGPKNVVITSSDGDKVEVTLKPGAPLEIKSIDGKAKGEVITIDGTKDIVIELENGDADPNSMLHVQMVCKLVGTPIMYDVFVTKARNTIKIPKEAFKNFEGSPSPFIKANTLIVNRVSEELHDDTDAGAIRTLSAYMDWTPVTMAGDLAKGNALTMGFDTTKNTAINIDMARAGLYNYKVSKSGPFYSPPVNQMKNVAVGSFAVRGNLKAEEISTQGDWIVKTKKWFPEMNDESWQLLAEMLYAEFKASLENDFGFNVLPLDKVVKSNSYQYAKSMIDTVTQNRVEVGAGGTKRILTTDPEDTWTDMGISFPADFISERLIQELNVDAVIAVTIDLNFDFGSEGLNPKVKIVSYAPNVSYKSASTYFSMTASTEAMSLSESKKHSGSETEVLYKMIKADQLIKEFSLSLKEFYAKEKEIPVYETLWNAKL